MTSTLPETGRLAGDASRQGHNVCWSCRAEVGGEPECPRCVKIQPLGPNSDYFSVLGLPRKLQIDPRVLEPIFHALSRRFHPDMYRLASTRERMIALENSAVLNQAYRTLRDPFERAAYLLQLEEGRLGDRKEVPPQDLFEEILEIQELLAEHRFAEGDEKDALTTQLREKRDALQSEQDQRASTLTEQLFGKWDALFDGPSSPTQEQKAPLLAQMRDILATRSYLKRVLKSLDDAVGA
jgi:molecular chaperone HscB